MDFYKLTATEFEELVSDLFSSWGFRTNITPKTGDGGVDIEANYDGEIFKGTYLIQCKLWKNNVGEPQIRDLYGAVQSRAALKGILVTSSDFSSQAKKFAENKNIDLINGETLRKLLNNTHTDIKKYIFPSFSPEVRGFLDDETFNNNLYNLLTTEIENNPKFEQPYLNLFELLLDTVLVMGGKSKNNGLLNEIIYYCKRYKDIFTKGRSNGEIGKRVAINYILLLVYLLKGDLTKVCNQLIEIRSSKFKGNILDKSYQAGVPSYYKRFLLEIDTVLKHLIYEQEFSSITISFTTSFYYYNDVFVQSIRPKSKEVSLEWILKEFKILENEDFENQKQLLSSLTKT